MIKKISKAMVQHLPRGPHNFSSEEIVEYQRKRLLEAMIECVSEKGYVHTSVADVLARAGISRATFYQIFTSKEDCFSAAFEAAAKELATKLLIGLQINNDDKNISEHEMNDPLHSLNRLLEQYLSLLVEEPSLARIFMVESYVAGPKILTQRQASLESFIDIIAIPFNQKPSLFDSPNEQRFAIKMIAHAISSMVTMMIGTGNTSQLPELREPLMKIAVKFIGDK